MTHAIEIAQSLHTTQTLSQYAAHRLATTPNRVGATLSDIVSLSSAAVIDSQIAAAKRPSETAGASRHESIEDHHHAIKFSNPNQLSPAQESERLHARVGGQLRRIALDEERLS